MGKLFYLMGKSASGKDKIYKLLMEHENLHLSPLVIYTTRPMRAGEEEGRQYHFIDETTLKLRESEGKVIECRGYDTVCGTWYYATIDDGSINVDGPDLLGIGTLESYAKMKDRFGSEKIVPLYIETEDATRLERAIKREKKQESPNYVELCRRFIADSEDFSEEKLKEQAIKMRFNNSGELDTCLGKVEEYIRSVLYSKSHELR